jgi:hypothetical protein
MYHSPTFPADGLHISPKGPVSGLTNIPSIKPEFEFKEPMAATWSFDHSAIYRSLYLCLAIANDLSLALGVTRIERKVIIIQLGYQFNSYNLMHIQES